MFFFILVPIFKEWIIIVNGNSIWQTNFIFLFLWCMYVYMLACPFTHLVSIYPDGMSALLVGAVPCIYWPVLTGIDEILTTNWKWALETTIKKAGHSSGKSAGILEGRSWIFSLAGVWVGRGWLNTHTIFTKLDSAEIIFKLWILSQRKYTAWSDWSIYL